MTTHFTDYGVPFRGCVSFKPRWSETAYRLDNETQLREGLTEAANLERKGKLEKRKGTDVFVFLLSMNQKHIVLDECVLSPVQVEEYGELSRVEEYNPDYRIVSLCKRILNTVWWKTE